MVLKAWPDVQRVRPGLTIPSHGALKMADEEIADDGLRRSDRRRADILIIADETTKGVPDRRRGSPTPRWRVLLRCSAIGGDSKRPTALLPD
jgi:hypothetical protein